MNHFSNFPRVFKIWKKLPNIEQKTSNMPNHETDFSLYRRNKKKMNGVRNLTFLTHGNNGLVQV